MHLEFVQFCMANDRWSGSSLALRSERPLASHLRQSGPSESSLADEEEAVRVGVRLFRRGPDLCAGSCLQRTWKKRSSRRRRSWRMTLCCNFDTFNDSVWRLEWFLSCLSTCQGDFCRGSDRLIRIPQALEALAVPPPALEEAILGPRCFPRTLSWKKRPLPAGREDLFHFEPVHSTRDASFLLKTSRQLLQCRLRQP